MKETSLEPKECNSRFIKHYRPLLSTKKKKYKRMKKEEWENVWRWWCSRWWWWWWLLSDKTLKELLVVEGLSEWVGRLCTELSLFFPPENTGGIDLKLPKDVKNYGFLHKCNVLWFVAGKLKECRQRVSQIVQLWCLDTGRSFEVVRRPYYRQKMSGTCE